MENQPIKLSILLPVRNEGINLVICLKILHAIIDIPYEVIVIYDIEDDNSIDVVKKLQKTYSHVLLVKNQLGVGVVNALRTGIEKASGKYILIFAADEVGPLLAVDAMLNLMDKGCDFVSATRYAYGGRRLGGSLIGGFLSRLANFLFRHISHSVFSDSTTGIKMIRSEILKAWDLKAAPVGWSVAFELAILAQLEGLKLGEVPIISIDRLYSGKSTFRLGPWFIEYLKWFIKGSIALWKMSKRDIPSIQIPNYYFKGRYEK